MHNISENKDKTRILFVCHGNICRSPMAEMIMKKMVADRGLAHLYQIDSAATSMEEIGNDIYPPAKAELRRQGIPFTSRGAWQMTEQDYHRYDRIFVMDTNNLRWLNRRMPGIVRYKNGRYSDPGGKISLLMTLVGRNDDVADPWYTGDFNRTYRDICEALTALLETI